MFDFLKNLTIYRNKYKTHSEAVIISCFFNPQNSPYRLKAFNVFYESIKHLNHQIVECVIGDAQPQLPENENIQRVYTPNLLWHKEALLNGVVSQLPEEYKYVFWVDADVLFTNYNWLVESVEKLQESRIVQPFEYCIHMERDEIAPSIDVESHKLMVQSPDYVTNRRVWRSFCANYVNGNLDKQESETYHMHGHVGFAWGARREVLEEMPLYDKALIGGADHIIAHAAAGQIPHCCITNAFADNINDVLEWSKNFYDVVHGDVEYVDGDLHHIWHGDVDKRQYLKRIKDFTAETKQIVQKDKNGLYVTHKEDHKYIKKYFKHREVGDYDSGYVDFDDDDFLMSMAVGYMTDSTMMGTIAGGNLPGAMIGQALNDATHRHDEIRSSPPVDDRVPEPVMQEPELLPMPREVAPDNFS